MSAPLWLSPLDHGVQWAGLPQPEAPPLWAYFGGEVSGEPWLRVASETQAKCHVRNQAFMRDHGWVEVPRVEWPAPQGGGE